MGLDYKISRPSPSESHPLSRRHSLKVLLVSKTVPPGGDKMFTCVNLCEHFKLKVPLWKGAGNSILSELKPAQIMKS